MVPCGDSLSPAFLCSDAPGLHVSAGGLGLGGLPCRGGEYRTRPAPQEEEGNDDDDDEDGDVGHHHLIHLILKEPHTLTA